ncbi:unnamed protein product [Enterobius vermicularis]|uniref:peptidylprolyl isomerase n=1 Tax=Enterobius vermicularis TaxID=51028 RepID=A0A0N4V8X1_ENTVE|nr:unnamed protein product [Enterobius vermicularis]
MATCEEGSQKVPLKDAGDKNEASGSRRAVSSGEPSSDGSIDEERSALSDSDLADALRIRVGFYFIIYFCCYISLIPFIDYKTIATQAKGPSSDALEAECWAEQSSHVFSADVEGVTNKEGAEWKDLLGNGQLLYRIISKGTGLRPRNGQEVVIRVEDKLFGSDSYEKITFILGYSMVIEAWDLVVSSLSEGDVAQVKSSSRLAYGSTGDSKRNILPDQDMEYEIELIKVGKPVVFSDMPEPVLSEHARQLKERGNYYYLRKEFEKAIFVYKRCTDIVEVSRDNEELRMLFSLIYSNLAACYAKLKDWKASLTAATEALNLNEKNAKALFRQANAYTNLSMISEAVESLTAALTVTPNDPLITKELQRVRILQRKCHEREKNLCRRMLAGMRLSESTPNRFKIRYRYLFSAAVFLAVAVLFHFCNSLMMSYISSFTEKV